ncbi:DNA repair protein RadC [Candidatus Woesearchaeota archaeon]|nr:DNA repair protein RadC [Candidatus Woesearchaeota archaeon]
MEHNSLKIKDFPLEERPRERLLGSGPSSLSTSELLAVILRTGNRKENVLELSKKLLKSHDLRSLSRLRASGLKKKCGIGEAKACQIIACFELGRRAAGLKSSKNKTINSAKDIAKSLIPELSGLKKEHLIGIFLNSRKKIIKKETIFIGSLDSSIIHPRELFKAALAESAAALILVHNHPSGDPIPSQDDISITEQIIKAGEILGISVLDHVITGENKYFSMKEESII